MPVSKRKKTVNVADIESVVARIARIPEKSVSRSDRDTLKTRRPSENAGLWTG